MEQQRVHNQGTEGPAVVGSGQATVDHLCVVGRHPQLDAKQSLSHYEVQPGGQVPTALVALRRWGVPVAFVGSFGDDPGGVLARSALAQEGVDLSGSVIVPNQAQPVSVILIDQATGERSVLSGPVSEGLKVPPQPSSRLLRSCRFLLLDAAEIGHATEAARAAKDFGVTVVLDIDRPAPGIQHLLQFTDVLIAAREFFLALTGEERVRAALEAAACFGPKILAATLGNGGVVARTARTEIFIPAYRVCAVDTTGAGDVFHAGCIFGLMQGWSLETTLRFAAASAALKCRRLGGRPGIPALSEVVAFQQHWSTTERKRPSRRGKHTVHVTNESSRR